MHRSNLTSRPAAARVCALVFFCLAAVSAMTPLGAAAAPPNPTFTFYGGGFGHGVGMSQYGAKGYAERGYSAAWMMPHYFPGTKLASLKTPRIVFVNVDRAATTGSGAYSRTSWQLRAGWSGRGISINGLASLPDTRAPFTFKPVAGTSKVAVTDSTGKAVPGSPFSGSVTVSMTGAPPSGSPALIQVVGKSGPFDYGSVRYRGIMDVTANSAGTKLKLLNELSIEGYLYGVVPRESPSTWPIEALKAQAIVSRSYADTDRSELFCDTRSQVYGGYSHKSSSGSTVYHEASSSNSAVIATKNLYVMYNGVVVTTYFSASSGGYTARSQDAWSATIPYLQGVPDPYGSGSYDPWTPVSMTGLSIASKLAGTTGAPSGAGTTWSVTGLTVDHQWPTGFALTTTVRWSNGTSAKTTTVSDGTLRSRLGLKSTKFFVNAVGDRLGQADRYLRAVAASKRTYPSGAKVAVIVNGDVGRYSDMACGVALAGVAHGPVLYVKSSSVPSAVSTEIKRLGATRVYVIGGTGAVSSTTLSKLKSLVPSTGRLAGADRYATAAVVAAKARALGADGTKAVVANGFVWADSLMAAQLAGASRRLLLLTGGSSVPAVTTTTLKASKTTSVIAVGSESSVPDAVIAGLTKATGRAPGRFGATGTSFDTAAAIAAYGKAHMNFSAYQVYVGPTASIPDAFLAGAMAAETRRVLLLSPAYTPPTGARNALRGWRSSVSRVVVVGQPVVMGFAPAWQLMSDAY